MNLEGLIAIGGDGTLKIALRLLKMGMKIVGVPKTIDNDLSKTDLTFGFDSAVAVATEAIDRLHTTAESHDRVMVLEVMGRYAGWIALYAGVAGGGDIILIPEIPFDIHRVCAKVKDRIRRGKHFSIVVVAEGAFPRKGKWVIQRTVEGSTDPIRLGGIGAETAQQIETLTGLESRFTVLGHLQRGGSPTSFDRLLATRFGYEALQFLVKGLFGKMVALKGNQLKAVPIFQAVHRLKTVPMNHPLVRAARAVGTSFGD
jgi:6-phosphofructokinase 1